MKLKKFLTFKSIALLVILIILVLGALFLTELMPTLNKQKSANAPEPVATLNENAKTQNQKKQTVAVNNPVAETNTDQVTSKGNTNNSGSAAVLGCKKQMIPYKVVYTKVTWLSEGETKVINQGKQGYKEICDSRSVGSGSEKKTVPAIDEQVFVGAKTRSVLTKISDETQKIIRSL